MTLLDELKAGTRNGWKAYTEHEFVRQVGDGSLKLAAFQDYLVQDYLYLLQFARANAVAIYKSHSLQEIAGSVAVISNILHEEESHKGLLRQWGVATEGIDDVPEKEVTIAYTRYVLDVGMSGDLLDLNVALAPCTFGYAEIGLALKPVVELQPNNPYRDWVNEYASDWYQQAARDASHQLDELAGGSLSARRKHKLSVIFSTATRLEAEFWQQSLNAVH